MTVPASLRRRSPLIVTLVILGVLALGFMSFASVWADVLWFTQAGYSQVLFTQWGALAVIAAVGFVLMALPVWLSLFLSYKLRPLSVRLSEGAERYREAVEPVRKLITNVGPIVVGILAGMNAAQQWPVVLQWLNKTPFGTVDPQFHLDASFYVYDLPFYRFAEMRTPP